MRDGSWPCSSRPSCSLLQSPAAGWMTWLLRLPLLVHVRLLLGPWDLVLALLLHVLRQ
jgi:hypothetical protein